MTEREWLACRNPDELLKEVNKQTQAERKWVCAMLAFADLSLNKPDKIALELTGIMARYADGFISRQEVAQHFETAMRGNGIDVDFDYGETELYLREALQSGTNPQELAETIRDIFGNPLRPSTIDQSWLTPNVAALAQAIYDERAFDRLPVLADALEEAGCTNADIPAHCREPGPHVLGCWAVDLLLGKE